MTVNEMKLTLGCNQPVDTIDRRITGFNLYRAEDDGAGRFVTFIDINDPSWVMNDTADYATIDVSDTMIQGASYEAITGISETVTDLSMKYTLATVMNFSLFVGICYTDLFDDASRMIFKSKPNKYMTFDASNEFALLDFIPKALYGFGGKVYAFGDNYYARINPEGMYVEETFKGKGIFSSKSVVNTDFGMVWCDQNGAYIMDQNGQVQELAYPIIETNEVFSNSWKMLFTNNTELSVVYVPDRKTIIFCDTYSGQAWAYYVPKGTWYYWFFPVTGWDKNTSLTVNSKGEVYFISKTSGTYGWFRLFAGTDYLDLTWVSREFVMTSGDEIKKFYKVVQDGNCTLTYGIDGNAPQTALVEDKIAVSDRRGHRIWVMLRGSAGSSLYYARRVDLVYRNLGIRS